MSLRPPLRAALFALLTSLAALAFCAPAFATHEQGGFITASMTAGGHLKGKIHYLTAGTCTVGTPTGQYPISVKSPLGTTASLNTDTATYTRCVPGQTTQVAPFDIDVSTAFDGVAPDGVWEVNFSSCCRVSGSRNITSTSTSFTASVRKVTGQATSAPVLDSNVASGIAVGYEYAQNLNASDPDGGTLTYQSRAGQPDGPNTDIVTYSADGWVRIPASLTATFSNGWTFVYKVRVVDSQGDYAERDVLLRTTTANKPPVIADPGSIVAEPGKTTIVNLSASDPNNAAPKVDTVALSAAGLPAWASLTTTPGNPATATLTLSPPADTPDGVAGVNLDAIDNDAVAPLMTTAHLAIAIGTRPDTTLTAGPAALSNAGAATFSFTSDLSGATFECRLDGASFAACSSPLTLIGLADGSHTFEVRAVKGALIDDSPEEHTFTVDTVAPAAPQVTSRPADVTTNATIAFTGTEAISCRVDGGAWEACASPLTPAGLADGAHTVELRAVDAAGNVSPITTVSFVLDTVAPGQPAITEGPSGATTAPDATFKVAGEPGGSYECRLDGGAWTACAGAATYRGLADGPHVFEVRQIDAAGNAGAARRQEFVVGKADTGRANAVQTAVASTAAVKPGGRVAVGCRLDHGALEICEVRAYVVVGGRKVAIGAGRVQLGSTVASSREVTVTLNARGRRLLKRAVGGLRVVFDTTATPAGSGARPLKATVKARVFASRTFVVPGEGLFASGSAKLTAKGTRYVFALRRQLRNVKAIRCVGHTDAIGTVAANQALGLRRARMVCHALTAGLPRKIRTSAGSAGERQPRASNATRAGRALNRRVELTVTYK